MPASKNTEQFLEIFTDKIDSDVRLWSVVKRLALETGRQHAKSYALALALSAIVAATAGSVAYLIKDVVNEIFVEKDSAALFALAGAVIVIFVGRGLAMFGQAVILQRIANAIVLELQVRLFRKALDKEPNYLAKTSSGELMAAIGLGASSASSLLNVLASSFLRDVMTLFALIVVLFIQDASLAIGAALVVPAIAYIISRVTGRLRRLSRQALQVGTELTNKIRSGIQGLRIVKAFSMEREFGDEVAAFAEERRRIANKHAVVSNRVAPFMELIGGVAISAAIAVGGWRVIHDGQTPGELVSFLFAALMAYDPARRLGQARTSIEQALVGVRVMYAFLDAEDKDVDPPGTPALVASKGEVRFDDVRFSYRPDEPVLRGISFVAPAGKTTAIVGRSGGGKTTISNLLLRFWRPDSGRITIDGQDIAAVDRDSLRRSIAFVGQDAFLFDGPIRDNIRAGNRQADNAAVIEAAKAAGAYEFISKLPRGLDTPAGELGSNISGGQKQRIAIARALIRNSPIVLLDEPTSALDNIMEREVQNSLRRLCDGRTVIVIAHRLSTIRNADQILVVDGGKIVETGKHDDLISAGGHYASLYRDESLEKPPTAEATA